MALVIRGKKLISTRRLSFLVYLLWPGVSSAGLAITLHGSEMPCSNLFSCSYDPGQTVRIDVYGHLTPSDDAPESLRVRLLQFDFADTDPELSINLLTTHVSPTGSVAFWDFGETPVCTSDPNRCGENYFIDDSLDSDSILSVVYTGLVSDGSRQITFFQDRHTLIGALEFTMPLEPGSYVIDLLNADDTQHGAELRAGFSVIGLGTLWRASEGEITGGRLHTSVIPEPASLVLFMLCGAFCVCLKKPSP